MAKTVKTGTTTNYIQHYAAGIEYNSASGINRRVEAIYHGEGRFFNTNTGTTTPTYRTEFSIKDHLSNARVTFTDLNANGKIDVTNSATTNEIIQENHYYAFGMAHEGPWMMTDRFCLQGKNRVPRRHSIGRELRPTGSQHRQIFLGTENLFLHQMLLESKDNNYLYNYKELNTDHDLKWYDYGARFYDAVIGRWHVVDPIAEVANSWSPYNYVENNPMNGIDPTGMSSEDALFNAAKKDPNAKNAYTANGYDNNGEKEESREITRDKDGNPTSVRIGFGNAREDQGCCPGPCCPYDKFDRSQEAILKMTKEEREESFGIFVTAATLWVPLKINWISKLKFFNFAAKGAAKLVPLGLGTTGRTVAKNLIKQMAMKNIMSNPALGKVIQEGMKDSRWLGWSKMLYTVKSKEGVTAVVHYVGKFENGVLKAVDDFKFK